MYAIKVHTKIWKWCRHQAVTLPLPEPLGVDTIAFQKSLITRMIKAFNGCC